MRLLLFQPDIPQNTAAMMRTAACLGIAVEVIEPCGFLFGDRQFRRAGLDYLDHVTLVRHPSWEAFCGARRNDDGARIVLLTKRAPVSYTAFRFHDDDLLMVGRETAGVPETIHAAVDARVAIPMRPELRSLNVAVAAAMVLGEALRQTAGFPGDRP